MSHFSIGEILIQDEKRFADADVLQTQGSDCSGSRDGPGFTPSARLRSRIEKLAHWWIDPSSLTFQEGDAVNGGHGTVVKAHRYWWKKEVAVKKMRIADNTDFERVLGLAVREAEFLLELNHPNIVKLEGFAEDLSKNIIWLLLPWAYNGNLREFVASQDWKILERISLINDVVKGVAYLHSRDPPICHSDLKSLNVLVDWEYRAAITDFGSAQRLARNEIPRQTDRIESEAQTEQQLQATFRASTNTITLSGNKYTLRWAAPELLMNDDRPGLWSDIWALGWIIYEVMTNSIPFQDVPADIVVIERVIKGDLPSVDDQIRLSLIEELCSFVSKCWKNDPAERPTANVCQGLLESMPKLIPKPPLAANTPDCGVRSPKLLIQHGDMRRRQGRYESAVNSFTEALQICADTGDKQCRAHALLGLAEVHRDLWEHKEAFKLYSQALQIWTELGDSRGRADAFWGLAEVHRDSSEHVEAARHYSLALNIRTEQGDRQGRAGALCGLAKVHQDCGEHNRADKLYSEALQLLTESGDEKWTATALYGLAQVHRDRREYNQAVQLYSQTLEICTRFSDRKGEAHALLGLAEVDRDRCEYSKAIEYYSQALHICTDLGDREGRGDAFRGLAITHRDRYESNKATENYAQALQTELSDRKGEADALYGLAEVHRDRGGYNKAVEYYSRALQICTELGDIKGRADALGGLAEVHRDRCNYKLAVVYDTQTLQIRSELGDKKCKSDAYSYKNAVQHYTHALRIRTKLGDIEGRAETLCDLAEAYRHRKQYDEAAEYYSQALQIRTELGDRKGKADALWGLAEVHRARREYTEAIGYYSQISQLRTELGDNKGTLDALCALAEVHKGRDELKEAAKYYSQALQIRVEVGNRKGKA